jgi:hypothetical protein
VRRDQSTHNKRDRSVENVCVISWEINLAATFPKWVPAKLRSFEVEQNPALRGPHERRRAGLSVFLVARSLGTADARFGKFTIQLRVPPSPLIFWNHEITATLPSKSLRNKDLHVKYSGIRG